MENSQEGKNESEEATYKVFQKEKWEPTVLSWA